MHHAVVTTFDDVPRAPVVFLDIDGTVLVADRGRAVSCVDADGLAALVSAAQWVVFVTARTDAKDGRARTTRRHLAAAGLDGVTRHHVVFTHGDVDAKGRHLVKFLSPGGRGAALAHLPGVFVDDNPQALDSIACEPLLAHIERYCIDTQAASVGVCPYRVTLAALPAPSARLA